MPRQNDWSSNDTISREHDRDRDRSGWRNSRDDERNSSAFFRSDGEQRYRSEDDERRERSRRDQDSNRDRHEGRREERHYGSDDYNRGIPMDETERLIASNKVEGTPVYDRHGDKLGTIHNFMVDKRKGHVVYAVLKHSGGFLGLGERYYPLEWDQLTYDTSIGGYHTKLDEEDLKSFGSFDRDGRWQRRRPHAQDRDRGYDSGRDDRG